MRRLMRALHCGRHSFISGYFVKRFRGTIKKINQLYLTRVTLNSRVTDKPVALEFQVELEFRNVSF